MKDKIIIGTRGSKLALWQANFISEQLRPHFGGVIELNVIKTKGDKILDSPLAKIGDKGLFVKEIENALLEKKADIAVHSMKDMPTDIPGGLLLAGASKREDPRDAFISLKYPDINELPRDAVIATSSLRRKAQFLHMRPFTKIVDIRGNVDTRVRKLTEGVADGLIMAVAGLKRMGLTQKITQVIGQSFMLPAVGQGCIALEARKDDERVREIVEKISCSEDFASVRAERALMKKLEGGCQVPIGALATINGDSLEIKAMVASLDGSLLLRDKQTGGKSDPESTGIALAEKLIEQGAGKILSEIRTDDTDGTRDADI